MKIQAKVSNKESEHFSTIEISDEEKEKLTIQKVELLMDMFYKNLYRRFPKNYKSYDEFKEQTIAYYKGGLVGDKPPEFESSITKEDIKIVFSL